MSLWNKYYLARSVDDALDELSRAQGAARLVAGGTDLLLDLQQGRHSPVDTLVDVTEIEEMSVIVEQHDKLFVGAGTPLNRLVANPLVQRHAQALVEAGSLIGGPQVRNTATLGGNVAHALPAGDGTIALLALDALAEVASKSGRRRVALESLFLGPGRSALDPVKEILVGFHLPLRSENEASAFRRVMRPQGVAIAILNMGVWVRRRSAIVEDVHLAISPGGPTPFRARETEEHLRGGIVRPGVISSAADVLLNEARFRTSRHRATLEYRRHLAAVLLEETLTTAMERAADQEILTPKAPSNGIDEAVR